MSAEKARRMTQNNLRTILLVALLLGACLSVSAAAEEANCDSAQCHAKLLTGKNMHPVAQACTSCHEPVSTPHPKKGTKTFKLTQEPPQLCYMCHPAFGTKSTVHFPVTGGMCTVCHNPHSSDEPKLLAQPLKSLCAMCHADHVDFKVVHGPVAAGDCIACHNPHESDEKKLLLKPGEQLCIGCHLDMAEVLKKKVVHPALSAGCTSCHNPHGSANPKLLAEEAPQLCFLCHSDIAEKVNTSPVVHTAVLMGCTLCHSPHASDNRRMLLNPEKDTCLGCHPAIIAKNMTVFHGPINEGRCTACHNPHGGQYPRMLAGTFPSEPYVPYTDTEFGVCFSCHKRDLLQYPETSFATNFRDGEKNLHYVHVNNKQKGRSCRLCHNIHGSPNPKLIADSVSFGKWDLPLKYVKTDTGGGCSPGCHKPRYYDRKTPGKKPEVEKPTPPPAS